MIELKDVNEILVGDGLNQANLPFLSATSSRIRLMAFQPKGDIVPAPDSLAVADRAELADQMSRFFALAKAKNADYATCPEYSCPWDALVRSVEAGVFPRQGALWSIGCESITPAELEVRENQLRACGVTVLRSPLVAGSGRFINFVCHLFYASDQVGQEKKVALLQAKTTPMGGTDYERDALICGRLIYRFGQADENRLVCLICSDVLGTEFRDNIVPQLKTNTLIVHLQLNKDSAAVGFSDYRSQCCYIQPRTTEILCLNWAAGTRIKIDNTFKDWVIEPKSIYYRTLTDIDDKDSDIIDNHKKGCFISYWKSMRTAAFIFHPDPQIFQLKVSKPLMIGAAPGAKRTTPKMEARYEWHDGLWKDATSDADDKFSVYLAAYPESAPHLMPYADRHVDLERLMQLSTGFVLDEDSFCWTQLRSFQLAEDDTSSRLRLCWSSSGSGAAHRSDCQRRFKALALVVKDPALLPLRLAAFRGKQLSLTYESSPTHRKFRNLVVGKTRGTVVFLGMEPELSVLDEAKEKLDKRLYDHGEDQYILSILYRDVSGALKDYMDKFPPAVNDDPNIDPVDISNA